MMSAGNRSIDQNGIISFFVVTIIMIVITLIVLSFSKLTRIEQEQVLETQLSAQAFYAAESGINDAIWAVNNGFTGEKQECNNWENSDFPSGFPSSPSNQLSAEAAYTCLLIEDNPSSIRYTDVPVNRSISFPVKSNDGSSINSIEISWQASDLGSSVSTATCGSQYPNFPRESAWPSSCDASVVRADLVPTAGSLSRSGLMNNNFSFLLYPSSGGSSSVSYNPSGSGSITRAACTGSATYVCSLRITGLGANQYFLRLRPSYVESDFEVAAFNGGTPIPLADAQLRIDSTGRASGVLKRIVISLPITHGIGPDTPGFAIQTEDEICKLLVTRPGQTNSGSPGACSIY